MDHYNNIEENQFEIQYALLCYRPKYPAAVMNSSKPQALNYGALVKLRETKSDVELLQELCKPDSGLQSLLNTKTSSMDANVIEGLLDVLVDLSSCDNLGSREYIIQVLLYRQVSFNTMYG